jgi:hypothetical protein
VIYEYRNAVTGLFECVDTEALTILRLAEIRAEYLKQESDRFTVAKVVAVGDDSTWSNADLDNDPEDCEYRMFVYTSGQYEAFTSLSYAKTRRRALINEFMPPADEVYKVVDAPTPQPSKPMFGYALLPQPITTIEAF